MSTIKNLRPVFTFLTLLGLLSVTGCGGSPLPSEVATGGGGTGPQAPVPVPLTLGVTGFIGGELAAGEASGANRGRVRKSPLVNNTGGVIPGANGIDLKDLGWGNLYTQGLSTAPLPATAAPVLRIFRQGSETPLATIGSVGSDGLFTTTFDAQVLRSGGRMELELEAGGVASRIDLPVLAVLDGDKLGFNVIRRQNGTIIAELFYDAVNNASSENGPDGLADNGIRIVVDSGTDLDRDGLPDTAARLDTADGFSFFDLNLDGRFGDPSNDSITFIDSNGSGQADLPLFLASEAQAISQPGATSLSFFYDPDLDGRPDDPETRNLGTLSEADFIDSMLVQLSPAQVQANGINSSTLAVGVRPATAGTPINATITFNLSREGGSLIAGADGGEAKFRSSGSQVAARLLSPADPEVRLLSNGMFLLFESVVSPALEPDSFPDPAEGTEEHPVVMPSVAVTVETGERAGNQPPLTETRSITLTPSQAPILTDVLFSGQVDVTGQTGGLEVLSRNAVLVWGAPVQVRGQNFALEASGNQVAVGGTPVTNFTVNSTGTQIDFFIPEGAQTGPVSVIVGGLGGLTSQNLVIAGQPLTVTGVSPFETEVPSNSSFELTFSRKLDPASVNSDTIMVRPTGGASLGWQVTMLNASTVSLSQGEGTSMSVGLEHEIVVSSALAVADTTPAVRFTPNLLSTIADPPATHVVATRDVIAVDTVAPILIASLPTASQSQVNPFAPIELTFDEAVSASGVAAAVSSGALTLERMDDFSPVPFTWRLADSDHKIVLVPTNGLSGATQYQLEIASESGIADASGNQVASFSITFTTRHGVKGISPRSGPIGTAVTVSGTGFSSGAATVRLGGNIVQQADVVSDSTIQFTVPAGSEGGSVVVEMSGATSTAPLFFTVTLNLQRVNFPTLVGSRPIGVTISADDSRVFASNQGLGSISVYDLNELTEVDSDGNAANGITRIQVGSVPSEATLSRDGSRLLTLDYGTPESAGDSFFVVDARDATGEPANESYSIEATAAVGMRPTRIATSPDGTRWYVTNTESGSLSVITAEPPFTVLASVPTGMGPNGVGISPNGDRAYVCNYLDGTVTVIDTISQESLGTVPVGVGPARAIVSPNGRWVVVSCNGDNTLHVIATATNQVVHTRTVQAGPSAMTFSANGQELFVCSRARDVVAILELTETESTVSFTEVGLIQAGRVPSGIAATRDGSRLVIANEEEGNVSVVWLRAPVQTITDVRGPNGLPTRFADEGQLVAIVGANFSPEASLNLVSFAGVPANVEPGSTTTSLLVTVPAGARSGPLTVTVGGELSNSVDFVVTPSVTRVTRITPSSGAVNVSPTTELVCRCNEPVRGGSGDWIVERLLDTFTNGVRDVDPTPVAGSVRLRDFSQELVFTPSQPLQQLPNSNNIYRITIRETITDLAGNPLQTSVVTRFRLADTRGPTLLRATLIDASGNGVDAGDLLLLVFDEVITNRVTLPGSADGMLQFSDGSTLGTGATVEFPDEALIARNSPDSPLGDFTRSLMIRLGTGANITVPGLRTAITGFVNPTGDAAFRDASGNTGINLASAAIDVGFYRIVVPAPQALSAILHDQNFNSIADAGEEIGIYFNLPFTQVGAIDSNMLETVGTGTSFGTGATFDLYPDNARVIRVIMGTGGSIDFNDPTHGIASSGISSLVNFLDVPVAAFAATDLSYSVGVPTDGPLIDSALATPVEYVDVTNNGLSQGDIVRVWFDRQVIVGSAPAATAFVLPVTGNTFGTGAYIRGSTDTGLTPAQRSRVVEIILGANPNVLPAGVGSGTQLAFGSPSVLAVNPNLPLWAIGDQFGNKALPDPNGTVFDFGSTDVTPPQLLVATYLDQNSNGVTDQGDQIALVFSESVRRNSATATTFRAVDGPTVFSLGAGATLTRGQAQPILGQTVADNVLIITLGAGTNIPLTIGTDIEVVTGNPVADGSGNALTAGSRTALRFTLPPDPRLLSALLLDRGTPGINQGDELYVRYDQPMRLEAGVTGPAQVLQLTRSGDSFGVGATVAFAASTAELRTLGLTTQPVGVTDPALLRVVLGQTPVISSVGPLYSSGYHSYTGATLASSLPSGVGVRPQRSLAYTAAQIGQVFDNSAQVGATTSFAATFRPAPAGPDISFNFSLGGGRTAVSSASDVTAVVNALNGAFVAANLRLRAFVVTAFNELVIADNGENLLATGGGFAVAGDVVNAPTAVFQAGSPVGISNLVGVTPVGSADLSVPAISTPLQMTAANIDSALGLITLTFNRAIEFAALPVPAVQVFALPVAGNSFGTGAIVNRISGTELRITLGTGFALTPNGVFSVANLTPGSPSGIRVRSSVTAAILADLAGNVPQSLNIDLVGTSLPPPEGLNVSGSGAAATKSVGQSLHNALAFSIASGGDDGLVTNLTLGYSGTGGAAQPNNAILRALLFRDTNGNGQRDAGDVLVGSGQFTGGSLSFASPLGTTLVTTAAPGRFVVVLELLPNPAAAGGTITISLNAVAATGGNPPQPLAINGLPVTSGTLTLDDSEGHGANPAAFIGSFTGTSVTDPAGGRTGQAIANTHRLRHVLMTIPAQQLATALDAGPDQRLDGVGIDLMGDGGQTASIVVSTAGTDVINGGINTDAELDSFVRACNEALAQSTEEHLRRTRASAAPGGHLEFWTYLEQGSDDNWHLNFFAFGSRGGIVLGNDAIQRTENLLNTQPDTMFPGPVSIITGGENASGTALSDFRVIRTSDAGVEFVPLSIPTGSPSMPARTDHVSVAVGESIYVIGGRNGTSVLSDVWRLDAIRNSDNSSQLFGDQETAMPTQARWVQLPSTGGPDVYGATAVYVHDTPGIKHSILVIGGATGPNGASPTGQVWAYNLQFGTWTQVTLTGDPLVARHGHIAIYDNNSRVMVFGGRTGTGSATTISSVRAINFSGNLNTAVVSTISSNPATAPWAGSYRPAVISDPFGTLSLIFGGMDSNGTIRSGGALMTLENLTTVRWSDATNMGGVGSHMTTRMAASVIPGEQLLLAYGTTPAGVSDQLEELEGGLVTSDISDDDWMAPLMAWFEPAPEQSVTTNALGTKAGDRVVISFGGPTRLLEEFPSGTISESELAGFLLADDGSMASNFSPGTTAVIESRRFTADTIVVTLGANVSLLDGPTPFVTFQLMGQGQAPHARLGTSGNDWFEGQLPVFGVPDPVVTYIWTGATSSDWFTAGNWTVNGAVATNPPSTADTVIIPHNAQRTCVISNDLAATPTGDVVVASIILGGGRLSTARNIVLNGNGTHRAAWGNALGRVDFVSNAGLTVNMQATAPQSALYAFGAGNYQNVSLTGAGTGSHANLTGFIGLRGSFNWSNPFGHGHDGAPVIFASGDQTKSLTGNLGEFDGILTRGTGSLEINGTAWAYELRVSGGSVNLVGGSRLALSEHIFIRTGSTITGGGVLALEGTGGTLNLNGATIPNLELGLDSRVEFDNGGFESGLVSWVPTGGWTTTTNGLSGDAVTFSGSNGSLSQTIAVNIDEDDDFGGGQLLVAAWIRADGVAAPASEVTGSLSFISTRGGQNEPKFFNLSGSALGRWHRIEVRIDAWQLANGSTVQFSVSDAVDFRVDNVSIQPINVNYSSFTAGNLNANSAALASLGKPATVVDLGNSPMLANATLALLYGGELDLTGANAIPAGVVVEVEGLVGSPSQPVLSLPAAQLALGGGLFLRNASASGSVGTSRIAVGPTGWADISDALLEDLAISVLASSSAGVSTLNLERTDLTGTPPAGLTSGNNNPTFVSLMETNLLSSTPESVHLRNIAFVGTAPTRSIEAAASVAAFPWQVRGAATGPGLLGPASEVDLVGTGDPVTTGAIRWESAQTLVITPQPLVENFAAPTATSVVIGSFEVLGAGVTTIDSMEIGIRTNANDETNPVFTQIRIEVASSGALVASATPNAENDPLVGFSGLNLSGIQVWNVVGVLATGVPAGVRAEAFIWSVGNITPIDIVGLGQDGTPIGAATIGTVSTPTVISVENQGFTFGTGRDIQINARNLSPSGTVQVAAKAGSGQVFNVGAALIPVSGDRILGVISADLGNFGTIQFPITVTYTHPGGQPVSFTVGLAGPYIPPVVSNAMITVNAPAVHSGNDLINFTVSDPDSRTYNTTFEFRIASGPWLPAPFITNGPGLPIGIINSQPTPQNYIAQWDTSFESGLGLGVNVPLSDVQFRILLNDPLANVGTGGTSNTFTVDNTIPTPAGESAIVIDRVVTTPSGQVTVDVRLRRATLQDPAGADFTLLFNDSELSYASSVAGPATTAAGKFLSANAISGGLIVVITGLNTNIIESGVVATLTFNVLRTSPGDIPLTVSGLTISSPAATTLTPVTSVNGVVRIVGP